MIDSIYSLLLDDTSRNLNMTMQRLKADTRRLAEYWEFALEHGNIADINIAILFLDTGIHGYLRAKGIDIGNKKALKKDQRLLNRMILLISMYAFSQHKELFPKIHELTPIAGQYEPYPKRSEDILDLAEKILRDKRRD